MDLNIAFGSVHHGILLHKSVKMGFRDVAIDLITSYLSWMYWQSDHVSLASKCTWYSTGIGA